MANQRDKTSGAKMGLKAEGTSGFGAGRREPPVIDGVATESAARESEHKLPVFSSAEAPLSAPSDDSASADSRVAPAQPIEMSPTPDHSLAPDGDASSETSSSTTESGEALVRSPADARASSKSDSSGQAADAPVAANGVLGHHKSAVFRTAGLIAAAVALVGCGFAWTVFFYGSATRESTDIKNTAVLAAEGAAIARVEALANSQTQQLAALSDRINVLQAQLNQAQEKIAASPPPVALLSPPNASENAFSENMQAHVLAQLQKDAQNVAREAVQANLRADLQAALPDALQMPVNAAVAAATAKASADLTADLAAKAAMAETKADAQISARIAPLGQRLAAIESKLSEPKSETRAPQSPETSAIGPDMLAARLVVAQALAQSLVDGQNLGDEIAALRRLGVAPDMLAAFEPFATTGAPSTQQLSREWLMLQPKIVAAAKPEDGDKLWTERLIARAQGLVKITADGAQTGDSPTALYSQVEAILARKDVARKDLGVAVQTANQLAQSLRGPASLSVAQWAQGAQQKLDAEQRARALLSQSVALLGKSKS